MATDLLTIDRIAVSNPAAEVPARVAANRRSGEGQGTESERARTTNIEKADAVAATRSWSAVAADYVQLTKPRIVVMILVTTLATAMIAAGGLVSAWMLFWLLAGTAAVAASAGAANQIWERTIDRSMTRTATRPLAARRLSLWPALIFTAALGLVGTALLAFLFGALPAAAGAVTWLMYVLVYTPMKTRTAWNTTVGAVAGALPMLIGYTAFGGTLFDATAWLLVGVLVAWQYPHFMAIAWIYRRQYAEAGFRMTTTVEPTGRSAGIQSVIGSLLLIAAGVGLCWTTSSVEAGWQEIFGWQTVSGVLASMVVFAVAYPMLRASVTFLRDPGDGTARKLLRSSLLVLPAVLLIVTLRVFC